MFVFGFAARRTTRPVLALLVFGLLLFFGTPSAAITASRRLPGSVNLSHAMQVVAVLFAATAFLPIPASGWMLELAILPGTLPLQIISTDVPPSISGGTSGWFLLVPLEPREPPERQEP